MKKIACVGYHETGAGVIDNIFRECDNVCQGAYEAELRFLHDPDGVSDLEYHLVNNPHRLSSSLAIKRFVRYAKLQNLQVKKVIGPEWMKLVESYADDLIVCKYQGYTYGDIIMLSPIKFLEFLVKKAFNKLKPKKYRYPVWHNYMPGLQTYYSRLTESEFLQKTKIFVDAICERINYSHKEYIMLDQFIGSDNPSRYLRYVDDIKVIIVDRDPRDLYIHHVLRKDKVLPYDPYKFCQVYRGIRVETSPSDKNVVLKLRFEDLVYNYDIYVQKVLDFVGISKTHHIAPMTHFDPIKSSQGTKLWEKHPEFNEAVKIIERELPEYIYNYEN